MCSWILVGTFKTSDLYSIYTEYIEKIHFLSLLWGKQFWLWLGAVHKLGIASHVEYSSKRQHLEDIVDRQNYHYGPPNQMNYPTEQESSASCTQCPWFTPYILGHFSRVKWKAIEHSYGFLIASGIFFTATIFNKSQSQWQSQSSEVSQWLCCHHVDFLSRCNMVQSKNLCTTPRSLWGYWLCLFVDLVGCL